MMRFERNQAFAGEGRARVDPFVERPTAREVAGAAFFTMAASILTLIAIGAWLA